MKTSSPAPRDSRGHYVQDGVQLFCGDSQVLCREWTSPTVIIVDGPYGIGSFPGDPVSPEGLSDWYKPHIEAWSAKAMPETTLWFWNTEVGWANVHAILLANDWEYRSCHIWNKGKGHIAGNANTKTLRKFPVVTEVCAQYVRKVRLQSQGTPLTLKEWLRAEWLRSGLPLSETNRACGVLNAATRKYFTKCHLWYFPPPEHFARLADYANKRGIPSGRPYFSSDGRKPISAAEWAKMRAKFFCEYGVSNVWSEPPIRGSERLKNGLKCIHRNQKPLKLLELLIRVSSHEKDVVWEPFGGLCSVAIAARKLNRQCFSAEILPDYFDVALRRLASADAEATFIAAEKQEHRRRSEIRSPRKGGAGSFVATLPFV